MAGVRLTGPPNAQTFNSASVQRTYAAARASLPNPNNANQHAVPEGHIRPTATSGSCHILARAMVATTREGSGRMVKIVLPEWSVQRTINKNAGDADEPITTDRARAARQ